MVKTHPLARKNNALGRGYELLERLENVHSSVMQQQNTQIRESQARKYQEFNSLQHEVAELSANVDDLEKEGKRLMTKSEQLRRKLVDSQNRKKTVQNTRRILEQRRSVRDPQELLNRILNETSASRRSILKRSSLINLSNADYTAAQAYVPESRVCQAEAREAAQATELSPASLPMQNAEYAILGYMIIGEAKRAHMALRQLLVELVSDLDDSNFRIVHSPEPTTDNAALLTQLHNHGDVRMVTGLVQHVVEFINVQELYQGAHGLMQILKKRRTGERLVGFKDFFLEMPPLQRPELHIFVAIDGLICTICCTQCEDTEGSAAAVEAASRLSHGLLLAARIGSGTHCTSFLEAGAKMGTLRAKHGLTALHLAASRGDIAAVRILLDHGHSPSSTDSFGRFAFHRPLMKGHHDVAELILRACLDPKTLEKRTKQVGIASEHRSQLTELLCWAALREGIPQEIMVHLARLLAAMFQVVEEQPGGPVSASLKAVMHSLCGLGEVPEVEQSIVASMEAFIGSLPDDVCSIALNILNDESWSPLDVAIDYQLHKLAAVLQRAGPAHHSLHYLVTRPSTTDEELSRWPGWWEGNADVDVLNSQGDTPLLAATSAGGPVRTLIDRRADLTRRNGSGLTALGLAKNCDAAPEIVALLEKEAGAVDDDPPLLHSAIMEMREAAAIQMIQSRPGRVHERDSAGRTALHLGAHRCHLALVDNLLRARSSVDAMDKDGNTPLYLAVHGADGVRHEMVWRLLLASRASPLQQNATEITPWLLAESLGLGEDLQRAITAARVSSEHQAAQAVRIAEESQDQGAEVAAKQRRSTRRSAMNVLLVSKLSSLKEDGSPLSPRSPISPFPASSAFAKALSPSPQAIPRDSTKSKVTSESEAGTEFCDLDELSAMIRAQEMAQLGLREAKERLSAQLAEHKQETAEIKKQLAAARTTDIQRQMRKIRVWKGELGKMNRRCIHLREDLQKKDAEVESQFERLKDVRQEHEDSMVEKEGLEKDLTLVSVRNLHVTKKLQRISEAAEGRRIEAKFLRNECEKKIKSMESTLSRTDKQIKSQEEIQRRLQSEIADRDAELEAQKASVAKLSEHLAELRAEQSQLCQQVPVAEAKVGELRSAEVAARELEERLADLVLLAPGDENAKKTVTRRLEAALDQAHEQSALRPEMLYSADVAYYHAIGKEPPTPIHLQNEEQNECQVDPEVAGDQEDHEEKESAVEPNLAEEEEESAVEPNLAEEEEV